MIPLTEQEEIDRDLDLWEAENNWKRDQKARTEAEWLLIFPQAKSKWGKMIKDTYKLIIKNSNDQITNVRARTTEQLLSNPTATNWRDDLIKERGRSDIRSLEKTIGRAQNGIRIVESVGNSRSQEKQNKITITSQMVVKAREYPLEKLVEINRQGFTRCFVHADKKPSAYCKGNFIHCFVCNKSWDTIAVLMERDGMSFRDAVLKLQ